MVKRVNFQLALGLADDFKLHAKRQGITRSKLLGRWLNNFSKLNIDSKGQVKYNGKLSTYNLRLDNSSIQILDSITSGLNLTKSNFLRLLIKQEIENNKTFTPTREPASSIRKLWENGKNTEIVEVFNTRDSINLDDYIFTIKACTEMGNFDRGKELIAQVGKRFMSRLINPKTISRLNLLKFEIALYDRDYSTVIALVPYLERMSRIELDLELRVLYKYHLATVYIIQEEVDKAINELEETLILPDTPDNLDKVKIFLRLGRYYTYKMRYKEAENCFNCAYNLISKLNNEHFRGWYLNEIGMLKYIKGDLGYAENIFKQASEVNTRNKSVRETFYSYRNLAKLAIVRNEHAQVDKYLSQADKYKFGEYDRLSLFKIYGSDRYLENLKKARSNSSVEYPYFSEYMISANKYLLNDSRLVNKEGANELARIARYGSYELIRVAAQKTLDEKKLQPVGHR